MREEQFFRELKNLDASELCKNLAQFYQTFEIKCYL